MKLKGMLASLVVVMFLFGFGVGFMTESNKHIDVSPEGVRNYCKILPEQTNGNSYCVIIDGFYKLTDGRSIRVKP